MLKKSLSTALIGGKVLALGALMGTTAIAQTAIVVDENDTVVETPAGNTAVVPGTAAAPGAPVGAVVDGEYRLIEQIDNDQAVAETLIAQGFSDVHILREGALMTVTAQRNGVPTELVYSIANGSLVSVDGVELRAEGDTSSEKDAGVATTATDATDDAADDGTDAGDDTDADGTDDGTDSDADSDGDSTGTDGTDGSDSSSDSDGSSDGSDSDSSGSDSDGSDSDGSDGGSDGSDGGDGGSDGSDGGDGGENNG